jgi:hypothetical protein
MPDRKNLVQRPEGNRKMCLFLEQKVDWLEVRGGPERPEFMKGMS